MAKCKGCGKKGLFLKLQSGLCSMCLEKLFPDDHGPFGLTKDMFLNPEKYAKEEKPLERNSENEMPGMVTSENGSYVPLDTLPSVYDVNGIKIIDNNYYEITSVTNIDNAKNDIESLNEYLVKAKRVCKSIPEFKFEKEKLKFKFVSTVFVRDYCTLSFSPLTKTGKVPSHPIVLHINQGEHVHGKIFYDKNGEIARVEISISVVTKKALKPAGFSQEVTIHKMVCTKKNDKLSIRFIYRIKNGENKKIYDSESI
ncbi:MAG: hypothetical protein IJ466_11735 [Clostridia bacterium]|nr:hypothetical protein [Clostridia bacterium]